MHMYKYLVLILNTSNFFLLHAHIPSIYYSTSHLTAVVGA